MADETSQPDSADTGVNADATGGGDSSAENSNLMDKLRGVFGGKKDYKKMLIASIIILAVGGMIAFMIWGWILALRAMFTGDPSNASYGGGICADAFDTSKLALYEAKSPTGDFDANWARKDEARQYAINTLGIPESSMKNPGKPNVENMIRAEIVNQFSKLGNTHGSTVVDAQIAALSYQEHESSAFNMFDSSGKPSYTISGDYAVTNIMSLSNDKFCLNGKDRDSKCSSYWKNKRTAASYDINYAVYLGVKEIMAAFSSTSVSGEGQQRWKNAIGYTFLPSNPKCYWEGGKSYCRFTVAINAWDSYLKKEIAYVCNTAFGTVDINNLSSWYYGQGQSPWGSKPGQCSGWSVNKYSSRGCAITSAAMIARYYGKNIDPYQMGAEMCNSTGSIALDVGVVARLLGKHYQSIATPSVSEVESALKHGPLLTQVQQAFQASGQHWVVIVAIKGDQVIINDPTTRSVGGAGKQWPTSEISKVRNIYWFTK